MSTNIPNKNIQYRGFEITPWFKVFKGGKQLFAGRQTGHIGSLAQAKGMIDMSLAKTEEMSNYSQRQLEKYGNVLPEPSILPDGTCENGEEEIERWAEYVELHSQLQSRENEY